MSQINAHEKCHDEQFVLTGRHPTHGAGNPIIGDLGMSDKFEEAYRRARRKVSAAAWRRLSDAEKEEAVAAELRALEEKPPGETCGSDDQSDGGGW